MKERPILFSTPMVQAILAGRKSQTRRIVRPQPLFKSSRNFIMPNDSPKKFHDSDDFESLSPYGKIRDILWVRETFTIIPPNLVYYKADHENKATGLWKPSIFMPKSACRIKLLVKNIRVERLQDIDESDALSEGINSFTKDNVGFKFGLDGWNWSYQTGFPFMCSSAKLAYSNLWEKINGKESWELNPWVWVIEFKKI